MGDLLKRGAEDSHGSLLGWVKGNSIEYCPVSDEGGDAVRECEVAGVKDLSLGVERGDRADGAGVGRACHGGGAAE